MQVTVQSRICGKPCQLTPEVVELRVQKTAETLGTTQAKGAQDIAKGRVMFKLWWIQVNET